MTPSARSDAGAHHKQRLLWGIFRSATLLCSLGSMVAFAQERNTNPLRQDASTPGLIPLPEMTAGDRYKGEDGGLYGGGQNEPPAAHLAAAEKESAEIKPRDARGAPSPDGSIVLLAIGMSNTTHEFSAFKALADNDPAKNPRVVIVDGAQSGRGAEEWSIDPTAERSWREADTRMKHAGVTAAQVQVIWLKQANHYPKTDPFENAKALRTHLTMIVNLARARYPNLRLAYLSSRSYGGYCGRHPEPESYETAFSVRWVVQDQIAGKGELNFDPSRGPVKAPLVLWGPYLWANGTTPRKGDGLVWKRADFISDGVHPSDSGRNKVADMLLGFFKGDSTARTWFLNRIHPGGSR